MNYGSSLCRIIMGAAVIMLLAHSGGYVSADTSALTDTEPLEGYSDDSREAFAGYTMQAFGISSPENFSTCAKENLNDREKLVYTEMLRQAVLIADGKQASAVMTVPLGETVTVMGSFADEKAEKSALKSAVSENVNMGKVVRALIADNPYEFYWFLKTTGYKWEAVIEESSAEGCSCSKIKVSMKVCAAYEGDEDFSLDTDVTSRPKKAAANAKNVIARYSGLTDGGKLYAYRDYICKEVSYDHDAASLNGKLTDLDPWQLIAVFDEDSSTNVVCEGYSKAFQYLCDNSDFSGDVYSILVTGEMNRMLHMWNIVTIEGNSYFCDVTNSDTGTVGSGGELFLCGMDGSPSEGYLKTFDNMPHAYSYNSDALLIYEEEELSVSENDFFPAPQLSVGISEGSPLLRWTASPKATSYRIYRSDIMSGRKDFLGFTAALCFSDPAPMSRAYSYTVVAYSSSYAVTSAVSSSENIILPAAGLDTPELSVSMSEGSPLLKWTASEGATSYRIYRTDTASGKREFLGFTAALCFSDPAPMGREYRYTVRAYDSVNAYFSDFSVAAVMTVPEAGLDTPELSVGISEGSAMLCWTASEGATSYRIYRTDTASGRREFLGLTAALHFTDTPPEGREYCYLVRAYDSLHGTFSDFSAFSCSL